MQRLPIRPFRITPRTKRGLNLVGELATILAIGQGNKSKGVTLETRIQA